MDRLRHDTLSGVVPGRSRVEVVSRVVLGMCLLAIVVGAVLIVWPRTTIGEVSVQDIAVDADDRTVWATVVTNSCGDPDRLVLQETTTEVLVTALVRQRSGDCDDVAIPHRLSGVLSAPLGARALRSGG